MAKPAGRTVDLKCAAVGIPKPNITWYHNGALLDTDRYGVSKGRTFLCCILIDKCATIYTVVPAIVKTTHSTR